MNNSTDEKFMKIALVEAHKAYKKGEVPIGCVLVVGDKIVSKSHNLRETTFDSTAHAEIIALRKASTKLKRWRLSDATLYVTCEPCVMCAGALVWARVKRIVFGCFDKKAGACGSVYEVISDKRLNHRVEIEHSVLEKDCSLLLKNFFKERRLK